MDKKIRRSVFYKYLVTGLIISFLLSIIWVRVLPAEKVTAAYDPTGRGIGYTAVMYNNSNGLPTSDANAITQTKEGFIWIGCYSGLIRYDGSDFYRYDSSTGISSVVSLYADSKDRLWIGTNESGAFVLEDGEFTSYGMDDGLKASSVRAIEEDAEGNILLATTLGLSYVNSEGILNDLGDERIDEEYISQLKHGSDGRIFGLTNSGSFFVLDQKKIVQFYDNEELGLGSVYSIYPDPDNPDFIYLGMRDARVIHMNLKEGPKSAVTYSTAPQQTIAGISKIGDQIWICADNGIGYLSGDKYVSLSDLPMTNSVEHVFSDYENNLWFTSSRQGVMKIVRNRFIDVSKTAGLPSLVVNTTCMKDGLLYIGTDSGLKIVNTSYEQVENDLTKMLDGIRIRSIREDSKGILWFGTNSDYGLLWYDPTDESYGSYNTENGLASNKVRTCLEMKDGRLAVATNAGINFIQNNEVKDYYGNKEGLRNLDILCLEETDDGTLLAGSDGDGIYVIGEDDVLRIGEEQGLSSNVILRIRQDPDEEKLFWIVTSNAINYMRDGVIHTIKNFPYPNNFDLVFDKEGRIWVIASNGIYTVSRDEMLEDKHIAYSLFDIESGLPSGPTANSYSCLDEDGTLYIASAAGVNSINIAEKETTDRIRLSVPFVMVDDTYISVKDNKVNIPSDCRRLTIYAYAFSYSLNNPRLSFRLEGFDEENTELFQNEMQPIVYTNLPGGNYNFRLSIIDTLSANETQVLDISITKEKLLSERIWFWILVFALAVLIIIGAIIFYFKRKTKALEEKQKERERLIDEMTNVFAKCIDIKDSYTNGHSQRVAKYAVMIAERMGKSKEELARIHRIALLHDIGKIMIPDDILNKPKRLDEDEFTIMKTHSEKGAEILNEVSIEPDLAIGAGFHHERIDGKGYPKGLTGDEIPEIAQIIAVADTFDAMYSTRPYRQQVDIQDVAKEIERIAGTQLNAEMAGILLQLIHEGAFDNLKL